VFVCGNGERGAARQRTDREAVVVVVVVVVVMVEIE
jgi:hypothetical protein